MEKNFFLGDSYKNIKEIQDIQYIDEILDGKIKMGITTKSLPKSPVKLTKKNL